MESTFKEEENSRQHPHLSEPQRRSLEVTLCEMERLVLHSRHIREIAQSGDQQGVLLRWHAALDESQVAQLKKLEDATLEQLMALRIGLDLWPRVEDLQHQLFSAFSILWADLEDTRPQRMIGYGELEPTATSVLEPAIEKLVEICRDFVTVLEKEKS